MSAHEEREDDPEVPSSVQGWRRNLLGVPLNQTPFAHFAQRFFEQRGWWVDQFIEHAPTCRHGRRIWMSERSPTLEWFDRFDARLASTSAPLTCLEASILAGAIRAERLPPEPWELEAAERWERAHRDDWERAHAEQVSQTRTAGGGGQRVDRATAPSSVCQGVTYYLRCPHCKERFDADPARYLSDGPESGHGGCHGKQPQGSAPIRFIRTPR